MNATGAPNLQALVEREVLHQIATTWRVVPQAVMSACPGADDEHILRAVRLLRDARAIENGPFTDALEEGRVSEDPVNVTRRGAGLLVYVQQRSSAA